MKTSIKTLSTICAVVMSLSLSAQRDRGNQKPQQPNNQQTQQNNNNANDRHVWASNNNHGSNWGVSVNFGNYSNYGGANNYGYNNNYYSVKRAARNSISQSANVIGQALQFSDWNDTYSPWLAKAIRHQQYAKQLYFWGDFAGALNHAERAGFLAWNTLSYFNNPYGYNNNAYPNPYSDPNNPYYRQNTSNNESQPNNTDDYSYRKSTADATQNTKANARTQAQPANTNVAKTELDGSLPQSKMNDRELLKLSAKDLDLE